MTPSTPLETELKFTLEEEHFRDLRQWLDDTGATLSRTFSNHYFDSTDLALRRNQYGLRLRVYPHDQTLLCLKGPNRSQEVGLSVRAEWEQAVDPTLALQCIEGSAALSVFPLTEPWKELEKLLDPADLSSLHCLGGITTERCLASRESFSLELDACTVGETRFYELEIETDDVKSARTWVTGLFVHLDMPIVPSKTTKLGRFFSWWRDQPK